METSRTEIEKERDIYIAEINNLRSELKETNSKIYMFAYQQANVQNPISGGGGQSFLDAPTNRLPPKAQNR